MPIRRDPINARRGNISLAGCVLAASIATGAGFAYRAYERHLNRAPDAPPFARGTLASIPHEFDQWTSSDVELDERIVKAADVDDYLQRELAHATARERLMVYVAAGGRPRDLLPHRPEVCYPTHGSTQKRVEEVTFGAGYPGRLFEFVPRATEQPNLLVLHYYIVDGEICRDEGALRQHARQGQTSLAYVASVQVTRAMPRNVDLNTAAEPLFDVAGWLTPEVQQRLDAAVAENRSAANERSTP